MPRLSSSRAVVFLKMCFHGASLCKHSRAYGFVEAQILGHSGPRHFTTAALHMEAECPNVDSNCVRAPPILQFT